MLVPPPPPEPVAASDAADDAEPLPPVAVGVYPERGDAWQRGLVVLAMGLPCWIVATEAGHELRVPAAADLGAVRHQLASYERESAAWPPFSPRPAPGPRRFRPPLSPLFWVLSIFVAFRVQLGEAALPEAALLDGERVFAHGEWWRVGTALWLHADLGHLVSNAGSGLLVFAAWLHTARRPVLGWGLLGAASLLGNLAAVALHHGEPYRSLGASTAVFAGLGLLTGAAVRRVLTADGAGRGAGRARRWRGFAAPLFSGLVVLGLLGAGEAHVDVLAHATGFVAGLLLGCLVRERERTGV